MIDLSELQRDALGEIFNIGVGRAASSLSQMVNQEIELSAPSIMLVRPADIATTLLGSEFHELSMVLLDFTGPFDARSMLIFPERNALSILSSMMDTGMSPEEMAEFEHEAMSEVGNIILNACISALADMFEAEFHGGLPVHQYATSDDLAALDTGEDAMVLLLQINLNIRQTHIEGHLLFLLSIHSLNSLMACLDSFLEKQGMA